MEGVQVFTVNVFQVCCIKHVGKTKIKIRDLTLKTMTKCPDLRTMINETLCL